MNRTYLIYGLIDPRDKLIHYIGMTMDLHARMRAHAVNHSGIPNTANWIANLEVEGLLPIVRIFCNVYGLYACGEEERSLIRKFYLEGHPLLNRNGLYGKTGQLVKQVHEMLDAP